MSQNEIRNIVLVHGGFVDGSGWEGVYKILKKDGYMVAVVQNPTISLGDDVAVARRTIANQNGPKTEHRSIMKIGAKGSLSSSATAGRFREVLVREET